MTRYCLALILLLFSTAELPAQRHGRADSIQNYRRGTIVTPPEFILDLGANQKKLRFTVARLRHMTRSTVTVKDHTTKRVRTFEGVDFSQLILAKGSELGVLEVSFGFFRKKNIPGRELNGNSKVVVADTVDGKTLSGSAPFRLVIELRQGDIQLFSHAT